MKKIMFVCHGNICRSPMAEFIMKDLLKTVRLDNSFYVQSSATSYEEIGHPVHWKTAEKLAREGISCGGKVATKFTNADYYTFDYIVAMDDKNIHNIMKIIEKDTEGKVKKLLSYAGTDDNILDPWYTGDFDTAFTDIKRGCEGLLQYLIKIEQPT